MERLLRLRFFNHAKTYYANNERSGLWFSNLPLLGLGDCFLGF